MPVKNLVIVESPGKIKSISKFLGKDYTIMACFGHVRDLPKSKMGIDVDNNFEPAYLISKDKEKTIKGLKKEIGKETVVWIATDEDREGEAIGWHLTEALKLKNGPNLKRIVFHEITEPAILEAIANPRDLNMNKVNAQQARRVLDRLVGYELSPLLWKKIQFGLSAGRVQSVVVRLIVDREREIMAFNPREYWSVNAKFTPEKSKEVFEAKLLKHKGKNINLENEADASAALKDLENAKFTVESVDKKTVMRNPAPPFTTSTLQQEAARKLGFSVKKTMVLAQKLYEGLSLGKSGHTGLITYMRTDSVNLSQSALTEAKEVISKEYGKDFTLETPRLYKGGKGAQEAHEAVRPTALSRLPKDLESYLEKDEYRLYELIWKRTLACQMAPAQLDQVGVSINAGDYEFRATGQRIRFAGFMALYMEGRDEDEENAKDEAEDGETYLPELVEGEKPHLQSIIPNQHFTKAPARYSEAALVKKLEAEGIGRPSTYAPTISTVQARAYVEKEGKQLKPTDIGFIVNDFLVEHFPKVVDYKFTARMEEMLDEVQDGSESWQNELKEFYTPFHDLVQEKENTVSREEAAKSRTLGIDPKSGKPVSVRMGRFGPFVQIGTKDDEEKPKFASLPKTLNREEVTLDEVMYLFNLPRNLGKNSKDEDVIASIGKFGPYIQIGKKYVSLKDHDPYTVELKEALEVFEADAEKRAKASIAVFENEGIQILEGPYGPYIKQGKKNTKIPKNTDPRSLSAADCLKLIAEAPEKKSFQRGKPKAKVAPKAKPKK